VPRALWGFSRGVPSVSAETGQSLPKLFCRMTATFPVGLGSQFVANLHVRCHSQEIQYCRRGCFPARPPILVRRWLLICRPRRRREARPAADPGLRNALTVSSSSASPCVAGVTRTERPRMRDVSSTAEEPMVCTTLRWREPDSNLRSPLEASEPHSAWICVRPTARPIAWSMRSRPMGGNAATR
jgi:hypothetical protein